MRIWSKDLQSLELRLQLRDAELERRGLRLQLLQSLKLPLQLTRARALCPHLRLSRGDNRLGFTGFRGMGGGGVQGVRFQESS